MRGGSFVRERAPAKRRSRSPGGSRSKGVSIFRSSAAAEDVRAQSAEGSASLLDAVVRNLETVQTERRGAVLQAAQFGAGSSKRGAEVVRKTAWLVRGASASVKRLRDLATDAAQVRGYRHRPFAKASARLSAGPLAASPKLTSPRETFPLRS